MPDRRYLAGLRVLLALNVLATILHYVDNIWHLPHYGEPAWVTPHLIDSFWFVMTPLAPLGYWLLTRGRRLGGSVALYAYALASLLVLLHYAIRPLAYFTARINALIFGEAVLAAALVLYVAAEQIFTSRRQQALAAG